MYFLDSVAFVWCNIPTNVIDGAKVWRRKIGVLVSLISGQEETIFSCHTNDSAEMEKWTVTGIGAIESRVLGGKNEMNVIATGDVEWDSWVLGLRESNKSGEVLGVC